MPCGPCVVRRRVEIAAGRARAVPPARPIFATALPRRRWRRARAVRPMCVPPASRRDRGGTSTRCAARMRDATALPSRRWWRARAVRPMCVPPAARRDRGGTALLRRASCIAFCLSTGITRSSPAILYCKSVAILLRFSFASGPSKSITSFIVLLKGVNFTLFTQTNSDLLNLPLFTTFRRVSADLSLLRLQRAETRSMGCIFPSAVTRTTPIGIFFA